MGAERHGRNLPLVRRQEPAVSKAAGLGNNPHREVRDAVVNLMEPKNRSRTELLFWSKHH